MLKEIDFQSDEDENNNKNSTINKSNENENKPIRKSLLRSKTTISHNPVLDEVHPEKSTKKMPLRKMKTTVSQTTKVTPKKDLNNPFKDPDLSIVSNDSFTKLKDGTVKRVRNKKNYKDLWLEKYNFIGVDMPEGGILHIEDEEKKKEDKKRKKFNRYKTMNYSNIESGKKKSDKGGSTRKLVKFDTSGIINNNKSTIENKKKSNLKNKDENILSKDLFDSINNDDDEDRNLLKMIDKQTLVDASTNPENINKFLTIEKNDNFLYNKSLEKEKEIADINKKKKEIEMMEEKNQKKKEMLEKMEREKNLEMEKFNNEKQKIIDELNKKKKEEEEKAKLKIKEMEEIEKNNRKKKKN